MTKKTIENYRSATNIFKNFLHGLNFNILSVDGIENKDILEDLKTGKVRKEDLPLDVIEELKQLLF